MDFIYAYEYDPITKIYKGIIESHLVNNSYPLPLNSTWTKPMEEKKAFILKDRRFADAEHENLVVSNVNPDEQLYIETVLKPTLDGDGWALKVDEIGKKWYNSNSQRIIVNFVGNPTDRGLVKDKPKLSRSYPGLSSYVFWRMMRKHGYSLTYFMSSVKDSAYYDEINEAIMTTTSYDMNNIIFNRIMDLLGIEDEKRKAMWLTYSQQYHQANELFFSPNNKIWNDINIGKDGLSKSFKKIEIMNPANNLYEQMEIPDDTDIKIFAREWIFNHGEYELDLTTEEINKYVNSARLVSENATDQ